MILIVVILSALAVEFTEGLMVFGVRYVRYPRFVISGSDLAMLNPRILQYRA